MGAGAAADSCPQVDIFGAGSCGPNRDHRNQAYRNQAYRNQAYRNQAYRNQAYRNQACD
jgi:hypothetical protein